MCKVFHCSVFYSHSLPITKQGPDLSAGLDLYAVTPDIIDPRTQKLIPLGTQVQLPKGCYERVAIGWWILITVDRCRYCCLIME
uniref:dUTPase-like domain-containing protein n=1 Tax=Pelusios castaneus TaxID=367368 RepID=A0A8C8VKN6_9SAUR